MESYIVFGAGLYSAKAISLLGKENIKFILDNNSLKWGTYIEGIIVCNPQDMKRYLKDYSVVVTVSQKYQTEVVDQLHRLGAKHIQFFQEIQTEYIKKKIKAKVDCIDIYKKAIGWINTYTLEGQSIVCNTDKKEGYPEVTGYFIPTLLRWGYRDLAISYAKWLCSIQMEDGSWTDVDKKASYVFDSAQILKGLIAIRKIYSEVDSHILKGCKWILSNMLDSGRLISPSSEAWESDRVCSELVHLYCLSPLVQAAEIFQKPEFKESAYKILNYYKRCYYKEIINFSLLSHFYAYVMEALLDMGEHELVKKAMEKVAEFQKDSGAIPAFPYVDWVCSTGLFQLALVWFRIGNIERGNKAFTYACKLQNPSGGWYGSYLSENNSGEDNTYFPSSEISWAVKYFLDALYYKNVAEFNQWSDLFLNEIDIDDGRYKIIRKIISEKYLFENKVLKILDAGCGKGRYIKNLLKDEPQNSYYAIDLSENVMRYITSKQVRKKQGSLTAIDYPDDFFDVVYACEALEHSIDVSNSIRELTRITKPGGKIVVIDKNKKELGRMEIEEWEVWFDAEELKSLMLLYCSDVQIVDQISYEKKTEDTLFLAWIGTVSK